MNLIPDPNHPEMHHVLHYCSISIHRWLLILTSALILSGCGQKGALYLPDDTSAEAVLQTSVEWIIFHIETARCMPKRLLWPPLPNAMARRHSCIHGRQLNPAGARMHKRSPGGMP